MRSTFKILFYLNTSKKRKSGEYPVMARITVDGSIAAFSIGKNIHPDLWDAEKGKASGKTREQMELNRAIAQTEQSIRDIYRQTVDSSGYVTAEHIKNVLTGVTAKTAGLLALFAEHNAEFRQRIGIDRSQSTCPAWESSYRHISNFIRTKYGLDDYPLQRLDMQFINGYDWYLRVDAKMATNTMLGHIIKLKSMIKRAIRQGSLQRDPFPEYEMDSQEHRYRHLSGEELERLMHTRIAPPKTCFIRDMFVFSCFTGLAYADVRSLSVANLRTAPDGNLWIDIPRKKTGVESHIRLLNIPAGIIEKYRPERKSDKVFNMPVHGIVTWHMRKLEKLCGISHLHYHVARHTFATEICLNNGVPMETLSKMMGHNSMHSTQIYGEITGKKIKKDMRKLSERIKEKYHTQTEI